MAFLLTASPYQNQSSISKYILGPLLGRGGFAEVFRARSKKSNQEVAIKFISKNKLSDDDAMCDRVRNEIKIHSQLEHHRIVKLMEYFEDENYVYMVLELCINGNLFKRIKSVGKLNETQSAKYSFQLLEAIQYLQNNFGVIHRDLKLSNILLDGNFNLKLCDFGLATQLGHPDEEHFTICGTPNYIAPEVASQQAHGFPVDLWSLGCLLFAMLTGKPPFEQGGVQETLRCIVIGEYDMPAHISELAKGFLNLLLNLDPTSRSNVQQTMAHPFLKQFAAANRDAYTLTGRDCNGSVATTAVASYDERNSEAVNKTAVNGAGLDYNTYRQEDMSTVCTSDICPQQLRLVPAQQASFEFEDKYLNNGKKTSNSSFALVNRSTHKDRPTRNQEEEYRLLRQTCPAFSSQRKYAYSVTSSDELSYAYAHTAEQENRHLRQSYPSLLEERYSQVLQHDAFRKPPGRHGHLVLGSQGDSPSLAISLDSSLHLGRSSCSYSKSIASFEAESASHNYSFCLDSNSVQPPHKPSRSSSSAEDASRRLWVPRKGQRGREKTPMQSPFCYCAPRGDVLVVSKRGDVIYMTYLRDKSSRLRPCRISVRASNPLQLLVGKVTKKMCKEVRDIREFAMRGSGFHHEQESGSAGATHTRSEGQAAVDRNSSGGFIGQDDFPQEELDILSDSLWLTSHHITKLPSSIRSIYSSVARMLEAVKCKIPKMILYLTEPDSDTATSSGNSAAVCKCMIMSNDPLPDFCVRWADGTKLMYSLSDGKLHIKNTSGSAENQYKWVGFASNGADWTTSAPEAIRKYLLLGQSAMRRCIAEDIKLEKSMDDSRQASSPRQYPVIVVESIHET